MTTQRKNINKEQFFTQYETANRLAKFLEEQPWFKSITKMLNCKISYQMILLCIITERFYMSATHHLEEWAS